jgi:citrate lyase subunit beta/citryl-CoA lyase
VAVVRGDEDLATELGCDPTSYTLTSVKFQLVLAAARAGVLQLGLIGTIAEFRDTARYQEFLNRSKGAELKGTLCIHPSQVDLANQTFLPTLAEAEHARR